MSKKDIPKEKRYIATHTGRFWKFTCKCGSEMWDNRKKKKTEKSPDLRCKNKECPYADEGYAHSIWLSDKERAQFDNKKNINSGNSSYKNNFNQSNKQGKQDMQVSYYGAWAKDLALYLAEKNNVKEWDSLRDLYDNCLSFVGESLEKHINKLEGQEKQVKDLSEETLPELEDTADTEDETESAIDIDDDFEDLEMDI